MNAVGECSLAPDHDMVTNSVVGSTLGDLLNSTSSFITKLSFIARDRSHAHHDVLVVESSGVQFHLDHAVGQWLDQTRPH